MRYVQAARYALLLALFAFAPVANAQKVGKAYKNKSLGVSYKVPSTLTQVPIDPASSLSCSKDKWSATKKPLYGKSGAFVWEMEVLAWGVDKIGPTTKSEPSKRKGPPREKKEKPRHEKPSSGKPSSGKPSRAITPARGNSYMNYVKEYKTVASWVLRGKKSRQRRGKRLPYEVYQFTESNNGTTWMTIAARYVIGTKEFVLSVYYPKECARKVEKTIWKCVQSLTPLAGKDLIAETIKVPGAKYATTPLRKRLLSKAAESIQGFAEWDIFATKHYIVLYSFDAKPGRKTKARTFAKRLARLMDEMHGQYEKWFPPHKEVQKWWSVLRICRNMEEFQRYGNAPSGVVGWFSPVTKELVIFNASKLGAFSTETVAFHEGWHQYANFWFPGAHLQRWFDEGHGDFFGSMKRLAKNKWVPQKSKMRKETIRRLVRDKSTVPLDEIVTWHMDKFYGPKATDYYAQGWAMVDFFYRGKNTPYWRKEWGSILPTYIRVALKTKDTEKATKAAFKGVDFEALEAAFAKYVRKGL